MCSAGGAAVPRARNADLEAYRFITERDGDRHKKLVVMYRDGTFIVHARALRGMEDPQRIFFEKNWADFLAGNIYADGYRHE